METILFYFDRDLNKLIAEIEAFPTEEALWHTTGAITNPAGNLALHIAGNLHHFIGAILGNTGYVRVREQEFADKNIPKTELIQRLQSAQNILHQVLGAMPDDQLRNIYPQNYFGDNRSNHFVLLQLLSHLNYHLGQVNYLRRMNS